MPPRKFGLALFPLLVMCLAPCAQPQTAGPLVVSSNPHYFQDAHGHALALAGSQTWNTLQDWGTDGHPVPGFQRLH